LSIERAARTAIASLVCTMFLLTALMPVIADADAGPTHSTISSADSRASGPVVFVNVTNSSGLGWGSRSRVAWGDYNNDGFDDLLFDGWSLWRNNGNGTFTSMDAIVALYRAGSRGGVWGDYDNDGYLDIYQMHGHEGDDRLFHNERDGTFKDVTSKAGQISDKNLPSEGAAWGDYDRDGYLDLYVANYEWPVDSANGTQDILYHNNRDGTFTNITAAAGIGTEAMCGRGVVWGDYDNDGWPDIYVSNYRLNPNFLWHNNGNGTFTDVAPTLNLAGDGGLGYYGHSIGSDWGDIENDGDLDLFVANLAHPRYIAFSDISKLYVNSGAPGYTFQDIPIQARGIAYEETHSNPVFGDYDNDGFLDLYITSVYDGRYSFLYKNDGNGRFTDVTTQSKSVVDNGWGAAWSDFNNDGFLDIVVGSGNATKFRLYQSGGGNGNHWFKAELRGTSSNSFGVGARVELEFNGTKMIREVEAGTGTTSEDHIGAHFGLGDWTGEVNVTIKWPSGVLQNVTGLSVDQDRTFIEPPARTDFRFVSVTYTGPDASGNIVEGSPVNFTATIENLGTVKGDGDLQLSVSGSGIVGTFPAMRGLGVYQAERYFVNWSTSGMKGPRTVTLAIVDADPEDSHPSDNEWSHDFYVNQRPVANIVSIDPPVAYQKRDTVEFTGSARDDGKIIDALWTSDLAGDLSHAMNFSMDASALSAGVHNIAFRVKDDRGAWSANATKTLMIEPPIENKLPVATITSIDPNPAKPDEPVTFEGSGSDPDGKVTSYRWTSSIDGFLSSSRRFSTNALSVGNHTITLVAIDDKGGQSEPATAMLTVKPANLRPTADIELIQPNPATEGDKVRFQGRGTDPDGTVEGFVWTSSMDGVISNDYDFSTTDLSVGQHTIGFKVKDDAGAWSPEVFATLDILPLNVKPTVTITVIEKRGDGSYRVKGTAEDTDGKVVLVQVKVGQGSYVNALPQADDWSIWYYDIVPKDLSLSAGKYTVLAQSFDGKDRSDEAQDTVTITTSCSLGVGSSCSPGDQLVRTFNDALAGNNMPCLLGAIVIIIILVTVIWNAFRSPPAPPPAKRKAKTTRPRSR